MKLTGIHIKLYSFRRFRNQIQITLKLYKNHYNCIKSYGPSCCPQRSWCAGPGDDAEYSGSDSAVSRPAVQPEPPIRLRFPVMFSAAALIGQW